MATGSAGRDVAAGPALNALRKELAECVHECKWTVENDGADVGIYRGIPPGTARESDVMELDFDQAGEFQGEIRERPNHVEARLGISCGGGNQGVDVLPLQTRTTRLPRMGARGDGRFAAFTRASNRSAFRWPDLPAAQECITNLTGWLR